MADSGRDDLRVPGSEGFFARWSRRKAEASREAQLAEAPPADAADAVPAAGAAGQGTGQGTETCAPFAEAAGGSSPAATWPGGGVAAPGESGEAGEARLTLSDVARLTRESDFTKFVASDVEIEVKNAALKKLFADPHFNVMDGLDVYIDDYNKTVPVPQSLIASFVQAKFLGLVDSHAERLVSSVSIAGDAPQAAGVSEPSAPAEHVPAAATVANATPGTTPAEAGSASASQVSPDEDADLQLQPDDAARRPGAEPGTEPDARNEH